MNTRADVDEILKKFIPAEVTRDFLMKSNRTHPHLSEFIENNCIRCSKHCDPESFGFFCCVLKLFATAPILDNKPTINQDPPNKKKLKPGVLFQVKNPTVKKKYNIYKDQQKIVENIACVIKGESL